MIRVLLVDDQEIVRAGLRTLLGVEPDIEIVGEAVNGRDAVRATARARPDVVLMDIRMPGLDGLEATSVICGPGGVPSARVIILTTFDLDEYVFGALRAGASGFLLKDTDPEDLLQAIRVVAAGEALLAPSVTKRLIEEFVRQPDPRRTAPEALESLTEREREVLTLVGQGLTNAEIASELFISPATAKTHVSRIMMKLAARDRAQLVIDAYESGLVSRRST